MTTLNLFREFTPNAGGQRDVFNKVYNCLYNNKYCAVDVRGGLGAGKNAVSSFLFTLALIFFGIRYGKKTRKAILFNIMGETNADVKEVMLSDILANLDAFKVSYTYTKSPVIIKLNDLNVKVEGMSAESPRAGRNSVGYWIDEPHKYRYPKSIEVIDDRCRWGGDDVPKFRIASGTPEPNVIIEQLENIDFDKFILPTIENVRWVGREYIERQKKKYTVEEQQCYLYGRQVRITANLIYYAFKEETHVIDYPMEITKQAEVYVGMDFNVQPFVAHLMQFETLGYDDEQSLIVKQTIELKNVDITSMCNEIKKRVRGTGCRVVVYPDSASGRDVSGVTDDQGELLTIYDRMRKEHGFKVLNYTRNPPVKNRVSRVNSALEKKLFYICRNESTTMLRRKYNQIKWARYKQKYQYGVMPDDNHWTDACDYAVISLLFSEKDIFNIK